jgi:hypothetical protein
MKDVAAIPSPGFVFPEVSMSRRTVQSMSAPATSSVMSLPKQPFVPVQANVPWVTPFRTSVIDSARAGGTLTNNIKQKTTIPNETFMVYFIVQSRMLPVLSIG